MKIKQIQQPMKHHLYQTDCKPRPCIHQHPFKQIYKVTLLRCFQLEQNYINQYVAAIQYTPELSVK